MNKFWRNSTSNSSNFRSNQGFWLLILSLIFLLNFLRLVGFSWLEIPEYQFYDYAQQRSFSAKSADEQRIVIVGINDNDLQQFPSTIPDDNTVADLISKISEHKPKAIGLDIVRDKPVGDGQSKLEAVFRQTKNLYGVGKFTGSELHSYFQPFSPPPVLLAEGRVGDASIMVDEDGVVRRGNLFPVADGENSVRSLALLLASHSLSEMGYGEKTAPSGDLQIGNQVFPVFNANDGGYLQADDGGYQILMNWYNPPQSLPQVSLTDVLSDNIPANLFENKIVLIGYTTMTLKQDTTRSPFSSQMRGTPQSIFGVEVQANLVDYLLGTVIDNKPVLTAIPNWLETLIISLAIVITGLIIGAISKIESPLILIVLGLLIIIILASFYFQINYYLLTRGLWLPIFPVGAIFFSGIAVIFNLLREKIAGYLNHLETEVERKTEELSQRNQELTETVSNLDQALKTIENQQEKLINQEKLAFLGRLTAGFCHQFKNPFYLTKYTIQHGIGILENYDLEDDEDYEDLSQLNKSLKEGEKSMEKLELLFKLILISPSRKTNTLLEASPNQFVENITASAVRFHSLEENSHLASQVDLELDSSLNSKMQIPQQLEIPLYNLVDNALDAVVAREEKEKNFKGSIRVTTRRASDNWQIIVEDNGGGISAEVQSKLFSPFVSTKSETDGIGLGLWMSQEIMTNFIKGEISVNTNNEQTLFCLNIPYFGV